MADNATLTNKKTSFDADTNADVPVRSTEKSGKQVQHTILDWGGTGAENTTVPDFATETTLGDILTAITGLASSTLPTTATHTRPSITSGSSQTALAANPSRKRAIAQNNTSSTFWLKEGATAVVGEGFPLFANQYYQAITTAALNVIQATGGALNLDILEAT